MNEPNQARQERLSQPDQAGQERINEANQERADADQNEAITELDDLDRRLIILLADSPRLGILECSRRLGVARGTAQARLDRLQRRGVIRGFGPDLDLGAIGYGVTAFVTLEIRQGRGAPVAAHLAKIPEVLEVHTTTGQGDLLARIVARSNADLQRVIYDVVGDADIVRTSTTIALSTPIPRRVLPLVRGG
jgi:DNA-binding Lrp family transcriptional regulator